MATEKTAVAKREENTVEFVPFGCSDKIRLTAGMVRQFIAVPTKSGALPTERDCIRFIMLCRGKRANPFEGDCFLIGYDTQIGPSFSLVCGLELFQKRASAEESYDGAESGVIVMGRDNTMIERSGTIVMEGEKIIGGWAKVYRKDRKQVEYKSVKFSTYDTGRSRWAKDPGGMIAKVALSQALRSAYPTALGGLYTREEMQSVAESGDGVAKVRPPVEMPRELQETTETQQPETPAPPASEPDEVQPPDNPAGKTITQAQIRRLMGKAHAANVTMGDLRRYVNAKGIEHMDDIPVAMYDAICAWVDAGGQESPPAGE